MAQRFTSAIVMIELRPAFPAQRQYRGAVQAGSMTSSVGSLATGTPTIGGRSPVE